MEEKLFRKEEGINYCVGRESKVSWDYLTRVTIFYYLLIKRENFFVL